LISKALEHLGISESDASLDLVDVRSFGCETLLAIPVLSKKELGVAIFDAHVALADNKTGEITSHHVEKQAWTSDAIILWKIEIAPTTYQLNESDRVFGLRAHYHTKSRPNPYSTTDLSLYIQDGEQFRRVLEDHATSTLRGETDTGCNGEYEVRQKALEIVNSKTNGLRDLKFTETIEKQISTDQNCERTTVETSEEVEVLKFTGAEYKGDV
jgi:hypothetical protein